MEYTVFGNEVVRRESTDHEWEPCGAEDVPEDELEKLRALAKRKAEFKAGATGPAGATGGVNAQPQ